MPHALTWRGLEIHEILGQGHSGLVYSARLLAPVGDLPAGTIVAVKRYKPWVLDEPGQLERIFRELEVGRSIKHPNLVDVLGAVLDPEGRPTLVMKFYEGPTLDSVLSEQRRTGTAFAAGSAVRLLAAVGAALDTLHGHGVIHRDLKPANVIVCPDGPVVADFGVVRSRDFVEQTTTGGFLGTVRYAAPEYLFGESYDNRIDIYSFGAVTYEVLTGRQHYGKYRHWARVVAAKLGGSTGLSNAELETIATNGDLRLARFARQVIEHSRCPIASRDLKLRSFVDAVEARIWETDSIFNSGEFVRQERIFSDRFSSPIAAAKYVQDHLDPQYVEMLRATLRKSIWRGWISGKKVNRVLFSELRRLEIIKAKARSGTHVRFPETLVEAVFDGLL